MWDTFTKTCLWLFDFYPDQVYRFNKETIRTFKEHHFSEKIFEQIFEELYQMPSGDEGECPSYVLCALIVVEYIHEWISREKIGSLTVEQWDHLLGLMTILDGNVTNYGIKDSFQKNRDIYEHIQSQSFLMQRFLTGLKNERELLDSFKEYAENTMFLEVIYSCMFEYRQKIIKKHLEYLYCIIVLMCMKESPYYDRITKNIADDLYECFKDLLSNSMIEAVYMEPNLIYSHEETGMRTTTKMEIFFYHMNMDRYCLRVDFPHDDVGYIHFNLHEPEERDTAFPIDAETYAELHERYGTVVEKLFYQCSGSFWFRNHFEKLMENQDLPEIRALFEAHKHMPFLENKYTKEDMNHFLMLLFEALSHFDQSGYIYQKPKNVSIRDHFDEMFRNVYAEELFFEKFHKECERLLEEN